MKVNVRDQLGEALCLSWEYTRVKINCILLFFFLEATETGTG